MARSTALKQPSPNGTKPRAFAIATRYVRDVVDAVVLDPLDDTDTGIRIGIRSLYSNEARAAGRAARAQIVTDEKGNVVSSPAQNLDALVEQTIGATAYWYHADLSKPRRADGSWEREEGLEDVLLIDEGETIACTPEHVRRLYSEPRTAWIQRQVQRVYLNLDDFFERPKAE